jgi:hypothetical protein
MSADSGDGQCGLADGPMSAVNFRVAVVASPGREVSVAVAARAALGPAGTAPRRPNGANSAEMRPGVNPDTSSALKNRAGAVMTASSAVGGSPVGTCRIRFTVGHRLAACRRGDCVLAAVARARRNDLLTVKLRAHRCFPFPRGAHRPNEPESVRVLRRSTIRQCRTLLSIVSVAQTGTHCHHPPPHSPG